MEDFISTSKDRKSIEKAMVFGNENVSLQDSFSKFRDRKLKEKQILKKCNGGLGMAQGRPQEYKDKLREKFIAQAKSYLGVPYAERFKAPDAPTAPLYLDCCGLVRQVLIDLQSEFGFVTGRWNQAYQIDTLPIVLTKEQMKPGDLIFYEGKYTNVQGRSKPQKHDMVHVEIFLGGETGDATIGARFFKGVVSIFPSSQFKSTTWDLVKCHYRSIDTWLDGECKSHCPEHPWVSDMWRDAAGKKSIFATEDENEDCDATNGIEVEEETCMPCSSSVSKEESPQSDSDASSRGETASDPTTNITNLNAIIDSKLSELKIDSPMILEEVKPNATPEPIHEVEKVLSKPKRYSSSAIDVLLSPSLLPFLDFDSLVSLRFVSKEVNESLSHPEDPLGYFMSICSAYAKKRGLYFPADQMIKSSDFKKYFFNEMLISKGKWGQNSGSSQIDFKVRVSARMRPGVANDESIQLPLHQFLKVKRRQQLAAKLADDEQQNSSTASTTLLVGENVPEEFVDPLLGITMKEPVMLSTSGRIVDNTVALQCILRGGRDPFNGKKLTNSMLKPVPELAAKIAKWNETRKDFDDVKVKLSESKCLLDDAMVDPVLLEAIMEAERLAENAKKAELGLHVNKSGGGRSCLDESVGDDIPTNDPATLSEDQEFGGDHSISTGANSDLSGEFSHNKESSTTSVGSIQMPSALQKKQLQSAKVIEVNAATAVVGMHVPGAGVRPFNFSSVNEGSATQEQVYANTTKDLVVATLNGFNSCILCYGQTGSGKTYTFFGPNTATDSISNLRADFGGEAGIVTRALREIMNAKNLMKKNGIEVTVVAQFVEIYDEQVQDLITGNHVTVRKETGELVGAAEHQLDSLESGIELLNIGNARKKFSATAMNDRSSRSHTALILLVSQKMDGIINSGNQDSDVIVKSSIHLVDLAGSERIKKSHADHGKLKKEAVGINSSLLVLGKVISALVENKSHVPYLESKLTTMLRPAFGGSSRTSVIINARMEEQHGDETMQSMRFGERCSMISNSAKLAATSLSATLATMDKAMEVIKQQISSFEARGLTHLDAYGKIQKSYQLLCHKRELLVSMNGKSSKVTLNI